MGLELNKNVTEAQVSEMLDTLYKNINDGNVNSFASYDEGVKDTIEWLLYDSNPPLVFDE
ncbi:MAG: hypothetical protein IKO09_05830 [Bacteroidales bacterium]|nr:hypothetical protein [Bacteroidales bacterium]